VAGERILQRIKMLVISTHSTSIENQILSLLCAAGWHLVAAVPTTAPYGRAHNRLPAPPPPESAGRTVNLGEGECFWQPRVYNFRIDTLCIQVFIVVMMSGTALAGCVVPVNALRMPTYSSATLLQYGSLHLMEYCS